MALSKYLTPDVVLTNVEAADKESLIRQMLDAVMNMPSMRETPGLTTESVYELLMTRERQRTTALGNGLACPHARIPGLHGLGIAAAFLKNPIDFGPPSHEQVTAVFLLLVPLERPTLAIKLLSQVARLWQDPVAAEVLRSQPEPTAACAFLVDSVFNIDVPLIAADIMRPPRVNIGPDTPLKTVTRIMLENDMDSLGVVSDDHTMLGEITCDRLFTVGMPEFFQQLKSVSFISEFDPFDRYFDKEAQEVAKNVMSTNFSVVSEQATLLEVVFELAVRKHSKVHVLRDGKRVGVIDRYVVLDRILNA